MIKEYYHDIDLNANQLFNSRLHNITTAARILLGGTLNVSHKGYQVYDTDLLVPYYWDGTTWQTAVNGAIWGNITGTITNQTDLISYLSGNYYPLSSNPAGYLTTETDSIFSAWLATPPNISTFTNDAGYITSVVAPTLQEVLDNNHDLLNGNNFQGTGAGLGNTGTNIIAIGTNAAQNNQRINVIAIGENAGKDVVGTSGGLLAIGYSAAINNSGGAVIAIGATSAQNNTGDIVTAINGAVGNSGTNIITIGGANYNTGTLVCAIGSNSAGNNTGSYVDAFGSGSANNNTANQVIAIGRNSCENNTGPQTTALGSYSGYNNSGYGVTAIGNGSANENTGNAITAVGTNSAYNNTGNLISAFGRNALEYNTGDNVLAFGEYAGSSNALSGMTIISNSVLPSYADFTAASAAINIGTGASYGCTYLYHDQATNSIGAVRIL